MGIFNYLKNVLGSGNNEAEEKKGPAVSPNFNRMYDDIILAAYRELKSTGHHYWWSLKANEIKVYNEKVVPLSDKDKTAFIIKATQEIHQFHKGRVSYSSDDKGWALIQIGETFQRHLLRGKLVLYDDDIAAIFNIFVNTSKYSYHDLLNWPVNLHLSQVEKQLKEREASPQLMALLKNMRISIEAGNDNISTVKEKIKLLQNQISLF